MANKQHRPPHAIYKLQEMIKLGKCDEVQEHVDENIEFYRERIEEQQELYVEAQMAKMGVKRKEGEPA